MGTTIAAQRARVLLTFLWVVLLGTPGESSETLDSSMLSSAIQELADTLGVNKMQDYADSLKYTSSPRDPKDIAYRLTQEMQRTFTTQKEALRTIKTNVEGSYLAYTFTPRAEVRECCKVQDLHQSYQFTVNITDQYSCDRISEAADASAKSINGNLDTVYMDNNQSPMKWQYFGSEYGIINQFPASKASDCSSYDHRFRPWYIASATPNPKDVVLLVKSNLFETDQTVIDVQFEAVNIILRTLNPKDRLAVLLYNDDVIKVGSSGCYSNMMSSATPANIERFLYFLDIRPDPQSGNDLASALRTAYKYFDNNKTEKRDRALLLFTDRERIDKPADKENVMDVISMNSGLNASMFVFIAIMDKIPPDVRLFYQSLLGISDDDESNHYIELPESSDLRRTMTDFYQSFAFAPTSSANEFSPVFMPPYFDLFGLDQLVLTLATPCYEGDVLLGVAAVDLTTSDLLASIEYFNEGELSYAFIIDNEGMTLYHPYLPVPSTNYTFVYLDIATLEPGPGFAEIRESMIKGESGCKNITSSRVLSRGATLHDGASILEVLSTYCWEPVEETPFSLCVVIPTGSTFLELPEPSSTFPSPEKDVYHRIDVANISQSLDLCQYMVHNAVMNQSTVKLSPESYSIPESYLIDIESDSQAVYMQGVVTTLIDQQQKLKAGVIDSIALTRHVNSLWMNDLGDYKNYMLWNYITTSDGTLRIFPGVRIRPKALDPTLRHWYQRAVAHVGTTTISFPYHDELGAGLVITLSQAIILPLHDNTVLGVMAADFTLAYFQLLLQQKVSICLGSDNYKCILIDNTAYIISHPEFVSNPEMASSRHLTELEPFISQDMLALGFLEQIHCNNLQYNTNFTVGPRRQVSYEVTNVVTSATEPLSGGSSQYCVFYKIDPVEMTNMFVIAVDLERTRKSKCLPIKCPCNPDASCSSLPSDCVCPCYQDLPPENYNPCEETFQNLTAPPCPVRFGVTSSKPRAYMEPDILNTSLPYCFNPDCSASSPVECESRVGCKYCSVDPSKPSEKKQCMVSEACPFPKPKSSPTPSLTWVPSPSNVLSTNNSVDPTTSFSWALVAGVFIGSTGFACLTIVVLCIMVVFLWKRPTSSSRLDIANPLETGDLSVTFKKVSEESQQQANNGMELLDVRYEKEPRPPGGLQLTGTPTESEISCTPSHLTGDTAYASGHCNDGSEVFSGVTEHLDHRGGVPSTVGSIDPSHLGGIWF